MRHTRTLTVLLAAGLAIALTSCGNHDNTEVSGRTGVSHDGNGILTLHVNTCENSTKHMEVHAGRENLAPDEQNPIIGSYTLDEPRSGSLFVRTSDPFPWSARGPFSLAQYAGSSHPGSLDRRRRPLETRIDPIQIEVPNQGRAGDSYRVHGKEVKNPSYVHAPGDELLLAAGLLAFHREGDDAEWQTTFTIITRTGEDAAGEVHDRMPAFLTPGAWDTWLSLEKIAKDQASDLLDLLDAESRAVAATLRTRPVSRAVNNVRTLDRHDAGLIESIAGGGAGR